MTNPLTALEADLDALRAEWSGAAPAFGDERVSAPSGGAGDDIPAMSDGGLVRALDAAARLRRQADVVLARLSAEIERRSDRAFGAEGLAKRHGHRNAPQLIAVTTGSPVREAAKLVRVGTAIRGRESFTGELLPPVRPHVASAFDDGRIGLDAANAICTMLDRVAPRTSPARASAYEAQLAGFAVGTSFSLLQRALAHAEARLDPDGVEPREELLHRQRSLTIHEEATGMVRFTARLDAVTAAPVKAAVEAIVSDMLRRREDQRRDSGREGDGDPGDRGYGGDGGGGTPIVSDERTIPQLQADALADLARHALGCAELPVVAATTVVVRMHLDALRADLESAGIGAAPVRPPTAAEHEPASPPAHVSPPSSPPAGASPPTSQPASASPPPPSSPPTHPSPPSSTPTGASPPTSQPAGARLPHSSPPPSARHPWPDRDAAISRCAVAELDGFDRRVSAATARRLAAEAELIPVVLGGDSEPLDLARRRRRFTRAQRLALAERDGGCASCGRNIAYVHAHHILWWKRDLGPTDISNGVLLCSHCHRTIHRGGWQIRAKAREVWFVPPPHIDPAQRPRLGGRARFELRAG